MEWGFKIDKPVCYILYGHSLKEFDDRIQEFKDFDVAWVTLNRWPIARAILAKIGKKVDYHFLFELCNSKSTPKVCPDAVWMKKSRARGNTLFESLVQCINNDVKNIFLFGADGFTDTPQQPFYGTNDVSPVGMYPEDLKRFNDNYPTELIAQKGCSIYNTSQISKYCIPKITIDECIEKLKTLHGQANTSL